MKTKLIILAALILLAGVAGYRHVLNVSAVETARAYARVAEFPLSKDHFAITVTGGFFSRGFIVEFDAGPQTIQDWIQKSPGLHEAHVTKTTEGTLLYAISPGEGVQFAEMVLSNKGRHVRLRTYWS